MDFNKDSQSGFFMDDGSPVNENFVKKPSLCVTCLKDDDPKEFMFCSLTRIDQQNESSFTCHAYDACRK